MNELKALYNFSGRVVNSLTRLTIIKIIQLKETLGIKDKLLNQKLYKITNLTFELQDMISLKDDL